MADGDSWNITRTVGEFGAIEKLGHRIALVASRAADEFKSAEELVSWLEHLDDVLAETYRRVARMKGGD